MPYSLGQKSNAQLATVDPRLRKVVERAIQITARDFSVLEGARSQNRQYELFAKGRTVNELRQAGVPDEVLARPGEPKVTWTLKSKHFVPAGEKLGRAVDLGVFPYDPKAGEREYRVLKEAMFRAATQLNTPLRWGGDWDGDGVTERGECDFGHFELK